MHATNVARDVATSDAVVRGWALELQGVSKAYRRDGSAPLETLRDLQLMVAEGEFVSVVGPSGCGKSTMLNLIAGRDPPTGGDIRIFGRASRATPGLVAHMPQRDLLLPWRNTLDNVILGPELRGVSRAAARRRALAHFPRFGLQGFELVYPHALSGGMRQRAALLRTILTERDILLLDEPFGALDALTRSEMQAWLLSIWREFRKTVLFVTHDVEEAVFLSDRVYVLSRRPGTVKLELSIDLPRPRAPEVVATERFVQAKRTLLQSLLSESQGEGRQHTSIEDG